MPSRRVVDDHGGLANNVFLQTSQRSSHLSGLHGRWRRDDRCRIQPRQRFANQIKRPFDLTMPQPPANMLHRVSKADSLALILFTAVRPAFHRLRNMLDAHPEMGPCVDGPLGSRASKRILPGGSTAIMCSAC